MTYDPDAAPHREAWKKAKEKDPARREQWKRVLKDFMDDRKANDAAEKLARDRADK